MIKRSDIRFMLTSLAGLCLFVFLLGDILRGKNFEMGPLQMLGTGIGSGILLAVFPSIRTFKEQGRISPLRYISWITAGSLVAFLTHRAGVEPFLFLTGVLLGNVGAILFISILLWKQFTRKQVAEVILVSMLIIPWMICIITQYIRLDFWYDEVYSLKWFILVPVINAVTDYNAPNNHILFSLLSNLYLKVIGIQDINQLVESTYKLRILMLVFSTSALIYFYLAVKKHFNRFIAATALLILATTIPFYNFAVQVRGYVLTIMLVCMLLYYVWNFESQGKTRDGILTIILSAFLLYTIPSNAYYLVSVALFYFVMATSQLMPHLQSHFHEINRKSGIKELLLPVLQNRSFQIALLMAAGCLLAFVGYLPVLEQLTNNALIKKPLLFPFKVFYPTMAKTYFFLLSERYLLVIFLLIAMAAYFTGHKFNKLNPKSDLLPDTDNKTSPLSEMETVTPQKSSLWFFEGGNQNNHVFGYWLMYAGFSMLIPFVISFFHGYDPYFRVFLFVAPVTAFVLALSFYQIYLSLPMRSHRPLAALLLLTLYCYLTFSFGLQHRNERILSDIKESQTSQNMFYNYYQAYYHPFKVIQNFTEHHLRHEIPVFIEKWGDTQAIPMYITKFVIRHNKIDSAAELFTNTEGKAHIITVHPYALIDETTQLFPDLSCEFLYPDPDFLGTLECICTSNIDENPACPPVKTDITIEKK